MSGTGKSKTQQVHLWLLGPGENWGWGVTIHRDRVSLWGDSNVLESESGGGLHNFVSKKKQLNYLRVNFMVSFSK